MNIVKFFQNLYENRNSLVIWQKMILRPDTLVPIWGSCGLYSADCNYFGILVCFYRWIKIRNSG